MSVVLDATIGDGRHTLRALPLPGSLLMTRTDEPQSPQNYSVSNNTVQRGRIAYLVDVFGAKGVALELIQAAFDNVDAALGLKGKEVRLLGADGAVARIGFCEGFRESSFVHKLAAVAVGAVSCLGHGGV